jgi:hypothetical protein
VKEHNAFRFRLFAHGLQWDCTRCLHCWHIWRFGVGAFFLRQIALFSFGIVEYPITRISPL